MDASHEAAEKAEAPIAWTRSEVQRLLAVVDKLDGTVGEIPEALYWGSLIRCAYDTGLRRDDLLAMTPDALQGDLVMMLLSKAGKPICRQLHPSTLTAIEVMKPGGRRLIWPWPYGREGFFTRFHEMVRAAGLTGSFKLLRRAPGSLVVHVNADSKGGAA